MWYIVCIYNIIVIISGGRHTTKPSKRHKSTKIIFRCWVRESCTAKCASSSTNQTTTTKPQRQTYESRKYIYIFEQFTAAQQQPRRRPTSRRSYNSVCTDNKNTTVESECSLLYTLTHKKSEDFGVFLASSASLAIVHYFSARCNFAFMYFENTLHKLFEIYTIVCVYIVFADFSALQITRVRTTRECNNQLSWIWFYLAHIKALCVWL